ncbi:MAG: hypothetical protein DCO97_21550, partial [Marivita sp. XM-24bin2]|uniref:AbrB/MazE/SpoVT family DNA-binding domain-containing protein n=2 Tax=Marivita TaxID=659428 RepID=UPI000D79F50E
RPKEFQIGRGPHHRSGPVISTALSGVAAIDRGLISGDYERMYELKEDSIMPKAQSMTFTREVAKSGNSAMVRLHKDELAHVGVEPGQAVRVTIEAVDDEYAATRQAAKKMRARFRRTLDLLA